MRIAAKILLLLALPAAAASIRLYLKDGGYHIVREYSIIGDRVRFYSTERSDWEEMPLELVDVNKTEATRKALAEEIAADRKADAEEAAAERAIRKMVASIPPEPGLYQISESTPLQTLPQAELKIVNSKRRRILKAITPIPILTGKSTVEIEGEHSKYVVADPRPEFYFRLAKPERFGLVRCLPGKGTRIVEKWDVVPVVNEIIAIHEEVQVFRKQVGEDFYLVWPIDPLPPGEYAWIQYTEGKGNTQAWDFRFDPAAKPR
jgi:hypothetical protein